MLVALLTTQLCISSQASLCGDEHTLDDQVGPEHTHGRDTNTSLSGTVGSTEAGEDDGGSAAHRSEKRLLWHVSKCHYIFARLLVSPARSTRTLIAMPSSSSGVCSCCGAARSCRQHIRRLEYCTYSIHGARLQICQHKLLRTILSTTEWPPDAFESFPDHDGDCCHPSGPPRLFAA
jgi:hypothetical protein